MTTTALLALWATCALPVSSDGAKSATLADRALTRTVNAYDAASRSESDVVPQPVFPSDGAAAVAADSLTWTPIAGARYDVSFGTSNPPPVVTSGLRDAAYAPGALTQAVRYFWRVTVHSPDGEITQSPIWSFSTAVRAGGTEAPAPRTRAIESALSSADTAISITAETSTDAANTVAWIETPVDVRAIPSAPLSTPPIAATVPISKTEVAKASSVAANDIVVAKTTATPAAGAASAGATSSTVAAVAAVVAAPVAVESVAVAASVTSAAGSATSSDSAAVATAATAVEYTAAAPASSPTAYAAITNRATYPKPPVPALGPAGYSLQDPTFGSRILRVTDGNTRPDTPNRSYRVAANAHLATWNATSTGFYVISTDGTAIPYSFDAATMTARRLNPTNNGEGGLTLAFYVEPHFSMTDPNLIYGVSGNNNRTVMRYDFAQGTYSTVLDLDTVVGGLAGTYVGSMMTAGTPENLMVFFGGPSQDAHFYLLWAPLGNLPARKLLNSVSSTINGRSTNITLNFHLHAAGADRSGRYVFLYPTAVDLSPPRSAAQVYIWDTQTDRFTALPSTMLPGGHDSYGYGYWVNQDCCTSSSWDATQWQFRYLSNPTVTSDLISPVLTPKEIYIDDHTSWNNARPDALMPVISSTYRYYGSNNTAPWRAWDDEIIAIDTTNGIGGTVWRFAHHRSDSSSDSDPTGLYFWYEPIASVSPDGRWVMFTSNWEKTLGRDSAEPAYRQDVFIVQLLPSGSPIPTPPPPAAPPRSPNAPPSGGAFQLVSTVAASTVTLDWQAPVGGAPVTGYVIEAGSAPGLSDLARIDTVSTHFVASDVGTGVYYVRVRAMNSLAPGPVSNETIVTVGGAPSAVMPGAANNVSVTIEGRDVTLRWNDAARASSYVLEAGSAPGRRDLAYLDTGSTNTGFFAPNVAPGVYYVRIRGSNPAGVGSASNEVVVTVR